ncbi:MAG: hypothetical protein LQ339_007083 [Xanthoria mediterranea]|nr:MAG: hypothetical protein LQ339_007083 [Xanthoria mediterranea]
MSLQARCQVISFLLATLSAIAFAADKDAPEGKICAVNPDNYVGNSQDRFQINDFINRGVCIRSHGDDRLCYQTLEATLASINFLRVGEYTGAASVLALLPTIGALLGAPTTEIWRLLTVVPFGGGLAMLLSFGGAILPVRVEDYEKDLSSAKVTFRAKPGRPSHEISEATRKELRTVVEKIESRMPLFIGAQAAMIIIKQGGVLPMVVYFQVVDAPMVLPRFVFRPPKYPQTPSPADAIVLTLVTGTALAENWAQLPFKETWKLFVSDVPYDVRVRGGDSIVSKLDKPEDSVTRVLEGLASLKAGTATIQGSRQHTRPRNAVLVVISVVGHGDQRIRSLLRLLSKCTSIATFVTGTALFASVQLLALPMAVFVLTLVLAAGVYGRAITGWIVQGVSKTEPLIHVIVNSTHEAQIVIREILSLDEYGTEDKEDPDETEIRKLQVELHGHVFVKQRYVAHRTPWNLRTWGVLARPYDLRRVDLQEKPARLGGDADGTPSSLQSDVELERGLLGRKEEDSRGGGVENLRSLTTRTLTSGSLHPL